MIADRYWYLLWMASLTQTRDTADWLFPGGSTDRHLSIRIRVQTRRIGRVTVVTKLDKLDIRTTDFQAEQVGMNRSRVRSRDLLHSSVSDYTTAPPLPDNSVTRRILTHQNFAMRLITFNGPTVSATPLYADLGILKCFDQVKVMNVLLCMFINISIVIFQLTLLKL